MTDYNGNSLPTFDSLFVTQSADGNVSANFIFFNTISSETFYFLMRGIDVDCGSLTYRTWVVTNTPDTTGSQYNGVKCGSSSLTNIVVAAKWSVIAS